MGIATSSQWSFLRPRFDDLELTLHEGNDGADPILEVLINDFNVLRLCEIRDALLLTSLMGQCEETHKFWIKALYKFVQVEDLKRRKVDYVLTPQYRLRIEAPGIINLSWQSLKYLVGYEGLGHEFLNDLNQTLGLLNEYGLDMTETPPIPIDLSLDLPLASSPEEQLYYLLIITTSIHQALTSSIEMHQLEPLCPRFELRSIDLTVRGFFVTGENVRQLQELLSLPLQMAHLQLHISDESRCPNWRHAWASLLFTICGHPLATVSTVHPVEKLSLVLTGQAEAMYQALCSVVVDSEKLKKLYIDDLSMTDSQTDTRWRWLVYALFSKASKSSVETLGASRSPLLHNSSNFDVASILNASFPRPHLLNRVRPVDEVDLGEVHLHSGTVIQLSSDDSDSFVVNESTGTSFWIIRDDSDSSFIDLLVPGYGLGTVEHSTLAISPSIESEKKHVNAKPSVTRLDLDHLYQQADANEQLTALLPYVGNQLLSIRFNGGGHSHDQHLQTILDNCPNLESLDLVGFELTSFQPILEACSKPGSALKDLGVSEWNLEDHYAYLKLLELLSDPFSTPARRLQRLELSDTIQSQPQAVPELLAKVVQHNTRLHFVELILPAGDISVYRRALHSEKGYTEPFEERDDPDDDYAGGGYTDDSSDDEEDAKPIEEEIRVASIPLPPRTKCAFLSVFSSHFADKSTTVHGLDAHAASLVLEYAARPVLRRVVILKREENDLFEA